MMSEYCKVETNIKENCLNFILANIQKQEKICLHDDHSSRKKKTEKYFGRNMHKSPNECRTVLSVCDHTQFDHIFIFSHSKQTENKLLEEIKEYF